MSGLARTGALAERETVVGPGAAPERIPLLDPRACDDWSLHVMLLSGQWRARHPAVPFYTLGQAAYLDAGSPSGGGYHDLDERRRNNALLRGRFLPLLERVAEVLERWAGAPMRLAETEAALPGFHIYLPHPAFAGPVARRHRDLQHVQAFPGRAARRGDLFSFTVPLTCPPGSGLSFWPGEHGAERRIDYLEGEMIVHDGQCDHRAELACTGEVERITLQGHGLRCGDHVVLYW
jgi:hypothetical protein